MINTRKNRENLYLYLTKLDVLTKIKPAIQDRPQFRVPWVYTQYMYEADCDHYHRVYFKTLGRIHSFCRSCWKVVARPRNLVQLFDLYEFQCTLGHPCKCGYEARDTVNGLWGGYFYNRSKEEGLERYKEVREWADSIDPEIPVILKRYCTEFEIGPDALGPSDKLPDQTPEEIAEERQIDNILKTEGPQYDRVQPDYIKAHVMRGWFHKAHKNGDNSYTQMTGGGKLLPSYVTYHDKD